MSTRVLRYLQLAKTLGASCLWSCVITTCVSGEYPHDGVVAWQYCTLPMPSNHNQDPSEALDSGTARLLALDRSL